MRSSRSDSSTDVGREARRPMLRAHSPTPIANTTKSSDHGSLALSELSAGSTRNG